MVHATVDEFTGKKQFEGSHLEWIRSNHILVSSFLRNHIDPDDFDVVKEEMEKHPYVHRKIIQENQNPNHKKIEKVVEKLGEDEGRIDLIVGGKGSGKTVEAWFLCELVHQEYDKPIYWMGPPFEGMPDYVDQTMDPSEIPTGGIVLIDEASVQFNARDSMDSEQVDMMKKIPVIRHKDKNALVITQSTNLTDRNWVDLADGIFFKEYQIFQAEGERDEITIQDDLKIYMPSTTEDEPPKGTLFVDNRDIIRYEHGLPEKFNPRMSTPYDKFSNDAEKYRFVIRLMEWYDDPETVNDLLQLRDASMDKVDIMLLQNIREDFGKEEMLEMPDDKLVRIVEKGFSDDPVCWRILGRDLPGLEYDFEMVEYLEEVHDRRRRDNTLYDLYSRKNWNKGFETTLHQRLDSGNVIFTFKGPTDTGKSWSAMSVAEDIVEVYNQENGTEKDPSKSIHLVWNTSEVQNILPDCEAGDVIIRDEDPTEEGTGSQSSEERLKTIEETLRQKQISFIFISPRLQTRNHNLILEPFGIDEEEETARLMVQTDEGYFMGYITVDRPRPKTLGPEGVNYEQEKMDFLERVMNNQADTKEYLMEMAVKFYNSDGFWRKGTKGSMISTIQVNSNLNKSEIDMVLNFMNEYFGEEYGCSLWGNGNRVEESKAMAMDEEISLEELKDTILLDIEN